MEEFNDLLYRIKLADQKTTQVFEQKLGISMTRYQMLTFLLTSSPCNQHLLQEVLQIDQAAITRHVKILEREGYINKGRNPENQREVLVSVTDMAREQLVTKPADSHLAVKASMESILTQEEREQFTSLLEKIVTGIEEIDHHLEENLS